MLQEGELTPVGDTRPVSVDVRIVAATHRDLAERVATGAFREDLYYRLNVITLRLPPLRERLEDLPVLVDHFLERHAAAGRGRKRLTDRALGRLTAYPWPGNVRELENEIERLVVLSGDEASIDEQLLSPRIGSAGRRRRRTAPGRSLPEAVAELERRMLAEALEAHRATAPGRRGPWGSPGATSSAISSASTSRATGRRGRERGPHRRRPLPLRAGGRRAAGAPPRRRARGHRGPGGAWPGTTRPTTIPGRCSGRTSTSPCRCGTWSGAPWPPGTR